MSQNKRALTVFSCVKTLTAGKGIFQLIKTKKKKLEKNLWKTILVKINEAIWFSLEKRYSRDSVKIQNSYRKQLSVLSVMINHTDGPRAYLKAPKEILIFFFLACQKKYNGTSHLDCFISSAQCLMWGFKGTGNF